MTVVTSCDNDPYCPAGLSWCWAKCFDLMSDEANCGSCDNHCGPDEDCVDSHCTSVNICICMSDDDCGDNSCCFEDCVCAHMDCAGLECGPDPVCGWECGPCQAGETCIDGTCTATNDHDADGDGYCDDSIVGQVPESDCPNDVCDEGLCIPTDCDDTDPDVNPGEHEGPFGAFSCADGIDNDCDMFTDILDPDCCNCSQDADCDDANVCLRNYCTDCMCWWELEPDGTPCGGAGLSCTEGVCGCGAGFTDCGGYCADLWTDPDNCTACGLVCDSPWPFECRCNYGICDCPTCYADCDGNVSNGDETDICDDVNNCGWCTHVCDVGQVCIDAECQDGPCMSEIQALSDEIYATPQGCTAVVRLDYLTMDILGYQLICGPYNALICEAGNGVVMLNPPDPDDECVLYVEPGDEGYVLAISASTSLSVFEGVIVHMGTGYIVYPTSWRAVSELGEDCRSSVSISEARGYDLIIGSTLPANEVEAAVDVVENTALPDAFVVGGELRSAVVLLYPRTIGLFDPNSAEWIVLINGGS